MTSLNYKLLAVCIVILAIGYILLGQGPADNVLSQSVAPFVIVITYLVLLPYAIIAKGKNTENSLQLKKVGISMSFDSFIEKEVIITKIVIN